MKVLLDHAKELILSTKTKGKNNIAESILKINNSIFNDSIAISKDIDWDQKLNKLTSAELDHLIDVSPIFEYFVYCVINICFFILFYFVLFCSVSINF